MSQVEKFFMQKKSLRDKFGKQFREHEPDREKVAIIEGMPIDADEKVELLLILGGAKSAADIEILGEAWEGAETPKHIELNLGVSISGDLKKLEFAFKMSEPEIESSEYVEDDSIPQEKAKPEDIKIRRREKITIEVAKNDRVKEELKRAIAENDHGTLGKLYGLPESAVEEFVNSDSKESNSLFGRADLPEEAKKDERTLFAIFSFSRGNWKQELNTAKKWADIVKKMSPLVYGEFVRKMRDMERF